MKTENCIVTSSTNKASFIVFWSSFSLRPAEHVTTYTNIINHAQGPFSTFCCNQ
jgi:hypothetical protein